MSVVQTTQIPSTQCVKPPLHPNNPTYYWATITNNVGESLEIIVYLNTNGDCIEIITELNIGKETQYQNYNSGFEMNNLFNRGQHNQYSNSNFRCRAQATNEDIKEYCKMHPDVETFKNEINRFMNGKIQQEGQNLVRCLSLRRKPPYKC